MSNITVAQYTGNDKLFFERMFMLGMGLCKNATNCNAPQDGSSEYLDGCTITSSAALNGTANNDAKVTYVTVVPYLRADAAFALASTLLAGGPPLNPALIVAYGAVSSGELKTTAGFNLDDKASSVSEPVKSEVSGSEPPPPPPGSTVQLTQVMTLAGVTVEQYTGATKESQERTNMLYQDLCREPLCVGDIAVAYKAGCGITSSVVSTRRSVKVNFVTTATPDVAEKAEAKALELASPAGQAALLLLASNVQSATPSLAAAVTPTGVVAEPPVTTVIAPPSSSSSSSTLLIVLLVVGSVVLLAAIGGGVFFFMNQGGASGGKAVAAPDIKLQDQPPRGGKYMKNGIWYDENGKPVPEQQV